MNLRAMSFLALMLATGFVLPSAKASAVVESASKTCSLQSPHFRACLSSSAAVTVRRDPTQPEAGTAHTVALHNRATGTYESIVVLLATASRLPISLAGVPLMVISEVRPDGTAGVSLQADAVLHPLNTYLDGVEQPVEAP